MPVSTQAAGAAAEPRRAPSGPRLSSPGPGLAHREAASQGCQLASHEGQLPKPRPEVQTETSVAVNPCTHSAGCAANGSMDHSVEKTESWRVCVGPFLPVSHSALLQKR